MPGKRYPIDKKECFSCGEPHDPDHMLKYVEGDYILYFCDMCSNKREHVKYALRHVDRMKNAEEERLNSSDEVHSGD